MAFARARFFRPRSVSRRSGYRGRSSGYRGGYGGATEAAYRRGLRAGARRRSYRSFAYR